VHVLIVSIFCCAQAAELDAENPMPLISKATIFLQVMQVLGGQFPSGRQITHDDLLAVCNRILEVHLAGSCVTAIFKTRSSLINCLTDRPEQRDRVQPEGPSFSFSCNHSSRNGGCSGVVRQGPRGFRSPMQE
jgi:hypothetical protein